MLPRSETVFSSSCRNSHELAYFPYMTWHTMLQSVFKWSKQASSYFNASFSLVFCFLFDSVQDTSKQLLRTAVLVYLLIYLFIHNNFHCGTIRLQSPWTMRVLLLLTRGLPKSEAVTAREGILPLQKYLLFQRL